MLQKQLVASQLEILICLIEPFDCTLVEISQAIALQQSTQKGILAGSIIHISFLYAAKESNKFPNLLNVKKGVMTPCPNLDIAWLQVLCLFYDQVFLYHWKEMTENWSDDQFNLLNSTVLSL